MHDGHILCPEHLVHGSFLGRIKPRELHGFKGEPACFLMRIEKISQISQTVVLGFHRAVEGVEHHLVARLVERQLNAHRHVSLLQFEQRCRVGYGNHHSVAVHIAHGACEGEVFQHLLFCLPVSLRGFVFPCLKEHDGSSELKVVFDVLVFGTEHLYGVLVERVVEAFPMRSGNQASPLFTFRCIPICSVCLRKASFSV